MTNKKIIATMGDAFRISSHAQKRMQQRSISEELVMYILEHGELEYSHHACHIRCLHAAPAPAGITRDLCRHNLPCVVVKNGVVITVKWSYQRIKRSYTRPRPSRRGRRIRK